MTKEEAEKLYDLALDTLEAMRARKKRKQKRTMQLLACRVLANEILRKQKRK